MNVALLQFLQESQQENSKSTARVQQELQQELNSPSLYSEALSMIEKSPLSRKEISESFGQKQVSGQLNKILTKLVEDELIERTIPEIKNHPDQKFKITKRGIIFLELLKK